MYDKTNKTKLAKQNSKSGKGTVESNTAVLAFSMLDFSKKDNL